MMSVNRMIRLSTQPPWNAASIPSDAPMRNTSDVGTRPTTIEIRADQMSRLRMSRPSSSLPRRNFGFVYCVLVKSGSMLLCGVSITVGSYGAISGAKIAMSAAAAMTARPTIAALFRRSRQNASPQSERCLRARTFISIARCWVGLVVMVAIRLPTSPA